MCHPSQLLDVAHLGGRLLAHETTYAEFSEELEAPARDREVVAVPAVGIVVIEDGFECFGGFEEELVTDVDPLVGVVSEDLCTKATKGRITASE